MLYSIQIKMDYSIRHIRLQGNKRITYKEMLLYMLKSSAIRHCFSVEILAGVEGIEPSAYGFGDRRSTS